MKFFLVLVTLAMLSPNSCNHTAAKPLIIGHRGAMGHETENTLASVQKAIDLGVAMIEIDVFKIYSGELVVFHDEHVNRLTNASGNIEAYNLADLKQLTLQGNHKIPLLRDVLDLINNQVALNIELKGANTAAGVHRIVTEYITEGGWTPDNVLISSFKWDELKAMRKLDTAMNIAVLTKKDPLKALAVAKALNAVAIHPHHTTLTKENTAKIHQQGLKVHTWTVNEPQDIQRVKEFGVDGIVTNYPERIR